MSTSFLGSLRFRRRLIAAAVAVALTAGTIAAFAPGDVRASAATLPELGRRAGRRRRRPVGAAGQGDARSRALIADLDEPGRRQAEVRRRPPARRTRRRRRTTTPRRSAAEAPAQADDAEKTAAQSEEQAGQLAAQLGRASANDVTTDLLTHPTDSRRPAYELGAMSKLSEQADGIYSQATQDRGTAQAEADKADAAKKALGRPGRRRPAEDAGCPVRRRRCSDAPSTPRTTTSRGSRRSSHS